MSSGNGRPELSARGSRISRYVGGIAFRDQLDWISAAWVLASFRRSVVSATPTPIRTNASVALKLPGAMQLMQVPVIAGASYMVRPSFCLSS
jgi:hypothetical protein